MSLKVFNGKVKFVGLVTHLFAPQLLIIRIHNVPDLLANLPTNRT